MPSRRVFERRPVLLALLACTFGPASGLAQSTQCLISGFIRNEKTGGPAAGAVVRFESEDGKFSGTVKSGSNGAYNLPLLSPGVYRLEASSDGFQPRRYDEITLAVAAFLEVDFNLRPLTDVFEQDISHNFYIPLTQRLLNFFGPDIDTTRMLLVSPLDGHEGRLTTSVSDVIDPAQIDDLPLTGRDIYTTLLLQPGVNADPSATRGLGFSVNGQRPSASSFLLDGVELSDYLISGPLVTPAPEAVEEFRVSTNNFSAEYGGTTGYIANAVTHAGTDKWHGVVYAVGANEDLNSNGFQENLSNFPRAPLREFEPGFRVGGPLWKKLVYISNSFDYTRLRTRLDPQSWQLPTAATVAGAPDNESGNLLRQYPAIVSPPGPANAAESVMLAPTSSLNQYLGISRLDVRTPNNAHHLLLRGEVSQFDRPDFYWTPYTAFISGFGRNSINIAAAVTDSIASNVINEVRLAWGTDLLAIGDNNHGLPQLSTCAPGFLCLPSSNSPFAYNNVGHNWQALDNLTVLLGSHSMKFGGGTVVRALDGYLRDGADGSFAFASLGDFLNDNPFEYMVTVSRNSAPLTTPDYNRQYRYSRPYFFAQDSWRINDHLALNYGLRWEYFGAPVNVGSQKDLLLAFGPGSTIIQEIEGAHFVPPGTGSQPLYSSDPGSWAPRFGVSWVPWRDRPLVLRGSYGVFYDSLFDNLWQTIELNSYIPASTLLLNGPTQYLNLAQAGLSSLPGLGVLPYQQEFQPTMFQPHLRNPMVQSAFIGAQDRIGIFTVEINGLASRGRRLLTTDFINRQCTIAAICDGEINGPTNNPNGLINPDLPPISYRANQGLSSYAAATALVKFNTKRIYGQVAYTLSHSMDNQSDPIAGDFSLESTSVSGGGAFYGRAAFVQQFNSTADFGNSDFDQRQSFVFFATASIPAPHGIGRARLIFEDWKISGLGSLRSGLPFNAYAILPQSPLSNIAIIDDRANLVDPSNIYEHVPIPGGVQILNPNAFAVPGNGQIGTAGRNAFFGPGTISANLSVSRSFHLRGTPESSRLTLRADAYNVLNHPNLFVDAENPSLPNSNFGSAQFGTTGVQTTFPVQVPLTESPREIQLSVRYVF